MCIGRGRAAKVGSSRRLVGIVTGKMNASRLARGEEGKSLHYVYLAKRSNEGVI